MQASPPTDKDKDKNSFVGINGQNVGMGFTNRDNLAKQQEQRKEITFTVINNDGSRENMRMLIDLKNIFSKQLPKMPKEYIVKLVFDKIHESMVLRRQDGKVIGGICFRMFKDRGFTQLAFLAITTQEQVRGYGTRLMNKLKQEMQKRNIRYLMTYADNLALGYFRKQGFTKEYTLPAQKWKGYTKDYEGGTMMECYIHEKIDYSQISQTIKMQKNYIVDKIQKMSNNQRIYETRQLQKLKNYLYESQTGEQQNFRVDPLLIPGVQEGGWSWSDYQQFKKLQQINFNSKCLNIVEQLKKHPAAWPFKEPVNVEEVIDYNLYILRPIDLKTIQTKLTQEKYTNKQSFVDDIMLMFENCRVYNQPETVYWKCANEVQQFILPYLNQLQEKQKQKQKGNKKKEEQLRARDFAIVVEDYYNKKKK